MRQPRTHAVLVAASLFLVPLVGCSEAPVQESGPVASETPSESPSESPGETPADPAGVAEALSGYAVGINGADVLYGKLSDGVMTTVAEVPGLLATNAIVRADGTAWVGSFGKVTSFAASGDTNTVRLPAATSGVLVYDDEDAVWGYTFDEVLRIALTGKVTGRWPLDGSGPLPAGAEPMGAAAGVLYVAAPGGKVLGFDGSKATPLGMLPFGLDGWSFADVDAAEVTPTAVYVADLVTGKVAVFDTTSGASTTVDVARPLARRETGRPVSLAADDEGGAWVSFEVPAVLGGSPDPEAAALARLDPSGAVMMGQPSEDLGELYDEVDGVLVSASITGSLVVADPATGEQVPLFASLGALMEAFHLVD